MTAKEAFLRTYDQECGSTVKLLRAYPSDKLDLRPAPPLKTARELGWVFAGEAMLGGKIWRDEFAKGAPSGRPAPPPQDWNEIVSTVEKAQRDFGDLVRKASDDDLRAGVHFMVGPKKLGQMARMEWCWFLLHDQIHHRGQFSIYMRIAGGKMPSIYGPTADEPWI